MSLSKKALDKRRATTKAWQQTHQDQVREYHRRARVKATRARRLAELNRIRTATRLVLRVVSNVISAHTQGRKNGR